MYKYPHNKGGKRTQNKYKKKAGKSKRYWKPYKDDDNDKKYKKYKKTCKKYYDYYKDY